MAQAKWRATSDFRELERDLEKVQKENAKLIQQMQRMANESRKSQRAQQRSINMQSRAMSSMSRGLTSATRQLSGLAAGWLSAQAALSLYNNTLREKREVEAAAARTQSQLGRAQEAALNNIVSLSKDVQTQLFRAAADIQRTVGVADRGVLISALGGAVSAGATPRQAVEVTRLAAALGRLNPESIDTLAGAAIDVQQATGVSVAKAGLGFLLSTGAQARVKDLNKLAQNVPRVASQIVTSAPAADKVQTSRTAAALFGELSKGLADFQGEVTRTAVISLGRELRRFTDTGFKLDRASMSALEAEGVLPEKVSAAVRMLDSGAQIPRDQRAKLRKIVDEASHIQPQDPGTVMGRLQLLRDPMLRRAFFARASLGEGRLEIEKMTTPKGMQKMVAARKKITFDESLVDRRLEAGRTLTPELRAGARTARIQGLIQRMDAGNQLGALLDQSRNILTEVGKRTRGRGTAKFIGKLGEMAQLGTEDFRQDPIGAQARFLQSRILDIKRPPKAPLFMPLPEAGGVLAQPTIRAREVSELTAGEREQIGWLREAVQQLKELQEVYKATQDKLQRAVSNGNKATANAARGGHTEN